MEKGKVGGRENRFVTETHEIMGAPQGLIEEESRLERGFLNIHVVVMGLIFGVSILIPVISFADVIVFKDGRKMSVEKAWVEEGEVKAKVYGGVVGYPKGSVARIEEEQPTTRLAEGAFKFDKWISDWE